MSPRKKKKKKVIGRTDRIDLPLFGLSDVECKIDTGADTSAIHCSNVKIIERDGVQTLTFKLLDPEHPAYVNKVIRVRDFTERKVRSSTGHTEHRFVISTTGILFGKEFNIEFTLTDRDTMRFPILLGRKLLKRGFLVDVTKRDLSFNKKSNGQETA